MTLKAGELGEQVGGGVAPRAVPDAPQVAAAPRLQAGLQVIAESEAQLWWAAKELRRQKKLADYVGRNEKTKIIVKLQQVRASARDSMCVFIKGSCTVMLEDRSRVQSFCLER